MGGDLPSAQFEAYSALSCCFLSERALSLHFCPGLRLLLPKLEPQRAKIAKSILAEAEAKIPATATTIFQKATAVE